MNEPNAQPDLAPFDAERIIAWCRRNGIQFAVTDDGQQVALPRGDAAPLRIIGRPERGVVTFALVVARGLPPERHAAVQDVCGRANARMFAGAWVLNAEIGQLYLRLSVPLRGAHYNDDALRWLVDTTLGTADAFLPDLRVALGQGTNVDPGALR
ncbi:MAG: YbjN domain-containing protein [Myxococcales bacterium]|nr:YbjN domain-containing protein [Myxococcales bacterium]